MDKLRIAAVTSILSGLVYLLFAARIDLLFQRLIRLNIKKNSNYRIQFFKRLSNGGHFAIGLPFVFFLIVGAVFICVSRLNFVHDYNIFLQSTANVLKGIKPVAVKITVVDIFSMLLYPLLIMMFLFFKAEASLMKSLKGDYKNKMALLRAKIDPKEYTDLEFRYGSISSLEDYITYMNELDILIKKHV